MVRFLMMALLLCVGSCTRLDCDLWNSSGFFGEATAADVRRCLAAGSDVNAQAQDGWTPLLVAAGFGAAETVAALIEAGADMEVRTGEGWTPLHVAAGFGDAGVIATLIEAGADMEAQDRSDWTPLHMAAEYGTAATVAALIKAGADPMAGDRDGRFPVDLAEDNPRVKDHDIFRILEETRAAFIEAEAMIIAWDKDDATPLHRAAREGNAVMVAALIKAGAD
ncbi:MAG: ankyrin repeat domain-containing protein, partial [Hyphomonadaceae bacterium]|nr:ankyrin repeat domain-containing protein [Hyphomonadaceae bacterium]